MKIVNLFILVLSGLSTGAALADRAVVSEMLYTYKLQGAIRPDAQAGQRLWLDTFIAKDGLERSCTTCHGDNLKQAGRHIRTKKLIKPMAPSVNPDRLTKTRDIKKWFKRNCKWTLGRECTAVEKADLLSFINQQ